MVRLFEIQTSNEVGQAFLEVDLKIDSFEYQVFRDNSKMQEHYYDPYCKDPSAIKHHLS